MSYLNTLKEDLEDALHRIEYVRKEMRNAVRYEFAHGNRSMRSIANECGVSYQTVFRMVHHEK